MATASRPWAYAEQVDAIFDGIQRVYEDEIIDERELLDPTIERWRWDEPAITLSWLDAERGTIAKNLRCIAGSETNPLNFTVEINAWRDVDTPPAGMGRVRHWRHDIVANSIRVNSHSDRLRGAILDAFRRADALAADDLTQIEDLSEP